MPPRASSADNLSTPQAATDIAAAIDDFFAEHADAAVLEDGKVLFDLRTAKHSLSAAHDRCTLHLWSDERNMVRRIVSFALRNGTMRLSTQRLGHAQSKLLELVSSRERRTPTTRESARTRYVKLVERVLLREFFDWKPEGFRTAMDLERSFGPAYARGSLTRGNQAWAVIGVNDAETATTIDGILTIGILWLDACREKADGRKLYQGLRVIVPRGMAMLTLSRLAWLNQDAAQWELYDLDQQTEELTQRDAGDHGNLRTRLIHHPDEAAAAERFAEAIEQVTKLVPVQDRERVDQRLRSTAELAFSVHGLEFARARVSLAPNSFAQRLEVTVGTGASEILLTEATREELAGNVAELFARRRAVNHATDFARRGRAPSRRIGAATTQAAHSKLQLGGKRKDTALSQQQDPLYRAAPERWLESVLRRDLAPLTHSLAPAPSRMSQAAQSNFANDADPDTRGNRADVVEDQLRVTADTGARIIPRLDPRHVYAQVPAIAGASDRGLLDLLGVTADARLAVIELKADDDLHLALQGLDYWIRVRHHHLATSATATVGEFQRHGYFHGVELSPLPPRLYLVAPALHIHPATEVVLRYISRRVEWHLLALDERWRQQIKVIWRKSNTA